MNNFGIVIAELSLDTEDIRITDLILSQAHKDTGIKNQRVNSKDLGIARAHAVSLAAAIPDNAITFAEVPVGSQSARAMASYGMCIGLLANVKGPLISVTATEVKMAATGNKNATKNDMIQWAVNKHPQAHWITIKRGGVSCPTNANEHLADALAAIYAGIKTPEFRMAMAMKNHARRDPC